MPYMSAEVVLRQLEADATEMFGKRQEQFEEALKIARFLAEVRQGAAGPWKQRAACRGHAEVMFPSKGQSSDAARALCESCPVQVECESWANETRAGGVTAGLDERARRKAARELRARS